MVVLNESSVKVTTQSELLADDPGHTLARLLELNLAIAALNSDLVKFQLHDSVECELQCQLRYVMLEFIELSVRYVTVVDFDEKLDTMADELMLARRSMIVNGAPKIVADAPISDTVIWAKPWDRADATLLISKWQFLLSSRQAEAKQNVRPFLPLARKLLPELGKFYQFALAA